MGFTSLIAKFKDETEEQEAILSQIQNESINNPNFGNLSTASHWTVNEVCHWLISIKQQTHCRIFTEHNIDGNLLLNHTTQHTLANQLKISLPNCKSILEAIDNL